MSSRLGLWIAAGATGLGVIAWSGRGSWILHGGLAVVSIYLAGSILILLVLFGLLRMIRVTRRGWGEFRSLFWIPVIVAYLWAGYFLGSMLAELDLRSAKTYAAEASVLIETYKKDHGKYPAQLSDIAGIQKQPQLLRYESTGENWWLWCGDPRGSSVEKDLNPRWQQRAQR